MPLSASEASIEAEIKTKGLTGPRLTPQDIDALIKIADYWVVPGTTTTVCALTLRNGFVVIGHSACADPANFDEALGERIAHDKAREKIWALEGYLLREKLWRSEQTYRALADAQPLPESYVQGFGFDVCGDPDLALRKPE